MKTIEKYKSAIDIHLRDHLPKTGLLSMSIRYSTLDGGKRIRPILCIAGFTACGGRGNKVIPIACSIELIHTFSLIHDDLPCMDDDNFRRGKPTNHRVFGEDLAVLTGDALLSLAYEWIAKVKGISSRTKIDIIKELCSCTGTNGLINGQVLDLRTPKQKITKKSIKSIYLKKTSLLITGSVRIGAILAGASKKQLMALTSYGKNLGLAFQIIDDLLDTDKDKGISYVKLFGREKALNYSDILIEKAIRSLKIFGEKGYFLKEIALKIARQVTK